MVDHENFHRTLLRVELQSQLLLHGREQGRTRGFGIRIGVPFQNPVVGAREAGPVDDESAKLVGEVGGQN